MVRVSSEDNKLVIKGAPSIFQEVIGGELKMSPAFGKDNIACNQPDLSRFRNKNGVLRVILEIVLGKTLTCYQRLREKGTDFRLEYSGCT